MPTVIPAAGAVKETSTAHQTAVLAGTVEASDCVPHGSLESCETVKPLLAEIAPSVAAFVPMFMMAIRWVGVAEPTVAFSKVVTPGYAHNGQVAGMPQVVLDQPELLLPWVMVKPEPQTNWPAMPTPVAVVLSTSIEPGAWSWNTKVPTLVTVLPLSVTPVMS